MIMDKKEAIAKGQDIDARVRIGKKGITEGIIGEIDRNLDDEEIVKIKILRNSPAQDIDDIADILEERTIGEVAETRGKTILMVER